MHLCALTVPDMDGLINKDLQASRVRCRCRLNLHSPALSSWKMASSSSSFLGKALSAWFTITEVQFRLYESNGLSWCFSFHIPYFLLTTGNTLLPKEHSRPHPLLHWVWGAQLVFPKSLILIQGIHALRTSQEDILKLQIALAFFWDIKASFLCP